MPEPERHPRATSPIVPAILAAALPAVVVAVGFWGFSYDDAFITYRYARNWAEGLGLVYNPGEAVLGTTAPGYALLLGLLARLTRLPVPGWGTLLSLASLALAAALAAVAAASGRPSSAEGSRPVAGAAIGAGLTGTCAMSLRWNVELLGAETFVVLALVVAAAFLALERDRPVAAGLLAAAAMACRLDAGLAAAALGLVLWRARRRFPVRFTAAGLIPLALWLAGLQARFGAVVPNTLAGKQSEFAFALQDYTAAEWLWLRRTLPLSGSLALLALAALGLFAGWRSGLWRRPFFAALVLWLVLHETAYRLLDVPFAPWYQVPLLFAVVWLAVLGARWIGGRLAARTPRPGTVLPAGLAVVLLLPVLVPSLRYVALQWGAPPDPRSRIYAAAGRFLEQDERGGAVAAVEIGALGWTCRGPVLDLGGLVSPRVLAAKASGTLPQLVAEERPSCLVDAPVFHGMVLGAVLAEPRIAAEYRPVAAFTAPEYGGGTVRLLCRDGLKGRAPRGQR